MNLMRPGQCYSILLTIPKKDDRTSQKIKWILCSLLSKSKCNMIFCPDLQGDLFYNLTVFFAYSKRHYLSYFSGTMHVIIYEILYYILHTYFDVSIFILLNYSSLIHGIMMCQHDEFPVLLDMSCVTCLFAFYILSNHLISTYHHNLYGMFKNYIRTTAEVHHGWFSLSVIPLNQLAFHKLFPIPFLLDFPIQTTSMFSYCSCKVFTREEKLLREHKYVISRERESFFE